MRRPRALLVDLDNTFVDRDRALVSWLRSLLPALPADDLDALVVSDGGGYGDKRAFFTRVAALAGGSASDIRRAFMRDFARHTQLRPDADALLRAFAGRVVVVTNGPTALQRGKLAAAGLAGRVTGAVIPAVIPAVISGELGVRKPDAAIFRHALALAGCAAGEALMVGDHPSLDVDGAGAAGIAGVFVTSRWFVPPTNCRAITQLTELT